MQCVHAHCFRGRDCIPYVNRRVISLSRSYRGTRYTEIVVSFFLSLSSLSSLSSLPLVVCCPLFGTNRQLVFHSSIRVSQRICVKRATLLLLKRRCIVIDKQADRLKKKKMLLRCVHTSLGTVVDSEISLSFFGLLIFHSRKYMSDICSEIDLSLHVTVLRVILIFRNNTYISTYFTRQSKCKKLPCLSLILFSLCLFFFCFIFF